ncbi:hypothetical protein ACVWWQ_000573 [Rhodanobacter sp. TND4EL1]
MQAFRLSGIDHHPFEALFLLSDDQLVQHGAMRRIANEANAFPCRVSLEDARVGEELLLLPYRHQDVASPYRASGPIFIRRGATRRVLAVNEVPSYVTRRLISLRAYDQTDMMIGASVCEGHATAVELQQCFDNPAVAYVHLHNARQGCFSCIAERADTSAARSSLSSQTFAASPGAGHGSEGRSLRCPDGPSFSGSRRSALVQSIATP